MKFKESLTDMVKSWKLDDDGEVLSADLDQNDGQVQVQVLKEFAKAKLVGT